MFKTCCSETTEISTPAAETAAEPLRGFDGEVLESSDPAVYTDAAVAVEPPQSTTTVSVAPDAASPVDADESPDALARTDDGSLCADIDRAIDLALADDQDGLAPLTQKGGLVSRHLPSDLLGAGGSALPLIDGPGFIDLWERQDEYTTEACGFPFFPAFLGTMVACADLPADAPAIQFDSGPCLDPREHPEALLTKSETIELLGAMGNSVSID